MNANAIAGWVRDRLIDLLPGWLDPQVAHIPDWALIVAAPTIALVVVLLALRWGHGLWDAARRTFDALLGRRKPVPATAEAVDAVRRQTEEILAILREAEGRPLGADAEAAREGAVASLVAEDSQPAREAVRNFTAGDLRDGFAVLERQARTEEAQAAATWRRLGALANGIDTARALAAYEQAFRLEPGDFWTCVFLARLRRQAGDLHGAHDDARAAEAAAATARERSVADNEFGDVLVAGGDLAGAKARYKQSLALAERLAVDNPGSAEARRDVSVSLNKLGDVLVAGGDLAGAKARYEQSLTLRERLAADNPGSAEAKRDVWVSLWRLAGIDGSGVTWDAVAARLEAMQAAGTLFPTDERFLAIARERSRQAAE